MGQFLLLHYPKEKAIFFKYSLILASERMRTEKFWVDLVFKSELTTGCGKSRVSERRRLVIPRGKAELTDLHSE